MDFYGSYERLLASDAESSSTISLMEQFFAALGKLTIFIVLAACMDGCRGFQSERSTPGSRLTHWLGINCKVREKNGNSLCAEVSIVTMRRAPSNGIQRERKRVTESLSINGIIITLKRGTHRFRRVQGQRTGRTRVENSHTMKILYYEALLP